MLLRGGHMYGRHNPRRAALTLALPYQGDRMAVALRRLSLMPRGNQLLGVWKSARAFAFSGAVVLLAGALQACAGVDPTAPGQPPGEPPPGQPPLQGLRDTTVISINASATRQRL